MAFSKSSVVIASRVYQLALPNQDLGDWAKQEEGSGSAVAKGSGDETKSFTNSVSRFSFGEAQRD
jgi:hypothetical protein